MLDEPLLESIRRSRRPHTPHLQRLVAHRDYARSLDAKVFFVTCSTLSPLAARLPPAYGCPTLRIDQPMIEEALRRPGSLAVLATNPTALEPCITMLNATGRPVEAQQVLVPHAFDACLAGDFARHDELLRGAIEATAADTVLLAQASMAGIYPALAAPIRARVLTSPHAALDALSHLLA
ncbi:MAG: aspartate/glutamate racemase family protein [Bryobacteraceae bacterium]